MAFATKTAMIQRFGERTLIELTDRSDPPSQVIDDAVLGIGMSDADAMISQALQTAGLVIDPNIPKIIPPVLVSIACDIARFRLSNLPIVPRGEIHPVEKRYNLAVAQLDSIASGKLDVPGTVAIDSLNSGVAIGTKRATFGSSFDAVFRTDYR
jgi:phage gp36-like protein